MKRNVLWLLLALFLLWRLFIPSSQGEGALSKLSLSFFSELFQNETARVVFDLDEKESVEVFGETGEAQWL